MFTLTQGAIFSGLRSEMYRDIPCYGIVVSARCDLANNKVPRIYFLTALPLKEWLLSDEGFKTVLSDVIKQLENDLIRDTQNNSLDWQSIKSFFSLDSLRKCLADLLQDGKISKNTANSILANFETYMEYTSEDISRKRREEIIRSKKKKVAAQINNINDGKLAHFAFLPRNAWEEDIHQEDGFIVDFLDINFISASDANRLRNGEIDDKNIKLRDDERERYDTMFFINNYPGYAMIECYIQSPWIEYLMQRFANSFIRIGVDGPQKGDIDRIWTAMFP